MTAPIPSRILAEPYRKRIERKVVFMVLTDVGAMELKEAAERVGISRSAMYHRLFCAKNTSWQEENIFAEFIPKTRTEPIPAQEVQPLPIKKAKRDPLTIKVGTWERREKVWARFRFEETLKHLSARDREYNDALKYNRSAAR
jgi:hypothetical protein